MGRKNKVYNISPENQEFLNSYESSFSNKITYYQYSMTIKNYLVSLGETSAVKIKPDVFEVYFNSLNIQQKSHIRGFYIYILNNNMGNVIFHINKKILVLLLQ
jgi:hypothetical protein